MSSFMTSQEHINLLVRSVMYKEKGELDIIAILPSLSAPENAGKDPWDAIGQLLVDTNARSLEATGWTVEPHDYTYRSPTRTYWATIEILCAIALYEYQACEAPDWPNSDARIVCNALRERMIARLPGFDDAYQRVSARLS